MKFKLLEAEGSNAQLSGAGNVCLLILSPVMIIWWKHTLPQAQDRQFYSLSSCGKGRSQPEEAVHYSWEQDEPHGQDRDVSIGQAWPCMLFLSSLMTICSSVACPFVFESFLLLAAGQWVLLASSAVFFFTVASDSLFDCLRVSHCLELVLSGFFLCPLLQSAVCVEAHKCFYRCFVTFRS